MKNELITSMFDSLTNSVAALRLRISNVKLEGIDLKRNVEIISFSLDNVAYRGVLRGRNRNLCVGFGEEGDRGIACRVFLDGDAELS